MKTISASLTVQVPKGVRVSVRAKRVTVQGPRGEVCRIFKHLSIDITVTKGGSAVQIDKYFGIKKELAAVRTVYSHIKNMIKGVQYGFRYKMKSVYAHFPINLSVASTKDQVEIRNFLGEKHNRSVKMPLGVFISTTGVKDEIQLDGNDIEAVSKGAALIHQCALVKKKDIRKFLDGIYVSEKGTVLPMEV